MAVPDVQTFIVEVELLIPGVPKKFMLFEPNIDALPPERHHFNTHVSHNDPARLVMSRPDRMVVGGVMLHNMRLGTWTFDCVTGMYTFTHRIACTSRGEGFKQLKWFAKWNRGQHHEVEVEID